MADIIHLLPESVANQIAAGEVVQRPASVIKELVENSIDAGSSQVKVITRDGGKSLIQVVDNGCGMSETDARMSFERHATSKIREANDLFAIRTLGFRGEALASVASVAQVVLRTRKHDSDLGVELVVSGSVVESQQPVNCAPGTSMAVRNLFFNVPARRKFLKTNNAELKHIIYEFQRVALANPDIEFVLEHNEDEIYNLPKSNLKQRIVHIFGKAINQNLTDINTDTTIVRISGFIGKPEFARRSPGEQFFFVNGRYMKHPYFNKAVLSAYEKILPPETIPSYFIFLDVDPDTIDINIHPTKTEIKFENELAIFQILMAATRESLGKFNLMPSIDFNTESSMDFPVFRNDRPLVSPEIMFNHSYNPFTEEQKRTRVGNDEDNLRNWETLYVQKPLPAEEQQVLPVEDGSHTDSLIQLKNRFILTPVKSGLMMIDQKRAHERILFEQYLRSFAMNYPLAQRTLFPETIELDQADYLVLREIMEDLHTIGFDIRDFGGNTVVLAGYPADSSFENARELLEVFLEQFKSTASDIKVNVRERISRSMAIAGSVGYGETLTRKAMQELVDALFACESPGYSPSGKPIVVITEMEEIEKRFK
ncbi:MAG TPA: DNA mismatch repair endonuclease MutL [Bacteroidales bacterium]|nr:DNA mismatch repair endonuclease MutL [Bacteroidales bacterium]